MKIVHVSFCGPVTDKFSYQDNLLPKYHKRMNNTVTMITSKYIFNQKGEIKIDNREEYLNEYGIKTIRLSSFLNMKMKFRYLFYPRLRKTIQRETPDILFVHGLQFFNIITIYKYIIRNPKVKLIIDNHADFTNSAQNWLSKNILHKIIWRKIAKLIEPYVHKFYGVLPLRVNFLHEVYGINMNKIDLLVMGADDDLVKVAKSNQSMIETRNRYKINQSDFLIVTGGKIDVYKIQTLKLMQSIIEVNDEKVKLIVFGSVDKDIKTDFNELLQNNKIIYAGWLDNLEIYKLISIANIAVYPGRHSVFWEQTVAMKIPIIVKYYTGLNHIDLGNNCVFLHKDSKQYYKDILLPIIKLYFQKGDIKLLYNNNLESQFMYSNIALKSLK